MSTGSEETPVNPKALPIIAMALLTFALLVDCRFIHALPAPEAVVQNRDWAAPSPGSEDDGRFVIATGQITDVVGAGQDAVAVTAFLRNTDGTRGQRIAATRTNEMGDFKLLCNQSPGPVEIIVRFSKEQFAELTQIITLGDDQPVPFIGAALEGNLKISGRVVHAADQQPVSAKIVFQNMFTNREVETGADGRFEIDSLSPVQGELEVTAEGFGRERKKIRVPLAEDVLIELKPERTATIIISNAAGLPVAGAAVECFDPARNDQRNLISGDDGVVEFRGLHFDADRLQVRVFKDGFVAIDGRGTTLSLPSKEIASSHPITLERAGEITGKVKDASTGEALHGARVFAGDTFSDFAPHDWTDPNGKYTLSGVRPGLTPVTVHLDGHAPDLKIIEIDAEAPAKLDFELGSPGTVRGTIKTQEGAPVVGVEVAATQWRGKSTLGLRAMTDHEGRFVIENTPSDEFTLAIQGMGTTQTRTVKPSEGTAEFVLDASAMRPAGVHRGDPVPPLTLITLAGERIELASQKGKTVLIVYWATWCGPCVAEIPRLIEVYEKYRGRNDFVMIGISRDFDETELREFLKTRPKMAWPQVFGESGGANAAAQAFGVGGIPAIYLVNVDGLIAAKDMRDDHIAVEVERLLARKAEP